MTAGRAPVPFEVYQPGVYLHGTKADLAIGELLTPGRESNFEPGRVMNYIYFTATLDAATWGAELAAGDGPGRIYVVEPTGDFEDDPNLTDKKFPGNPTQSFRSLEPVRVVGELVPLGRAPARGVDRDARGRRRSPAPGRQRDRRLSTRRSSGSAAAANVRSHRPSSKVTTVVPGALPDDIAASAAGASSRRSCATPGDSGRAGRRRSRRACAG